jgi:hypothetical protein
MIYKKYKIFAAALMFIGATCFTSCDKVGDTDIGGTSVEAMSGDWWIIALEPDGTTPAYGGDYEQFTTHNTADNNGQLWIDDHGHHMEIKTKVFTNLSGMTFEGTPDSDELYGPAKVTVTNGKIIRNAVTVASKDVVDSIYFEAEFDWDAGIVYKFAGHKRVDHPENDHPHY